MIELALILATGTLAQAGSIENDLARAIQDAFTANQAASAGGEIRFRYKKGTAASLAAARAGEFHPRYDAEGRFAFKGPQAYYERRFAEEDMLSTTKQTGPAQWVSVLNSFRAATDGKATLVDRISANPGQAPSHSVSLVDRQPQIVG